MSVRGIALVLIGLVYVVKPDIFRRWFWRETSALQRSLSPNNYLRFMRVFGVILIIIGVLLMMYDR